MVVLPAGTVMEQLAAPLAPATLVTTEIDWIPGDDVKSMMTLKVPSAAVTDAPLTGLPAPLGVAVICTARPPKGGETKPLTRMETELELFVPLSSCIEHGSCKRKPLAAAWAGNKTCSTIGLDQSTGMRW
ncbi:hypothetical protein [Desulfofustis glycolicus]|uniref:hypothetical protein n=1 Tax=Desulfofustis glycolicus TaxID=51195 RepID=UPI0009353700|nr:hypothetical protein [Desulfofustis glycolicus]MCB2216505.1 hypothetical protein [Desulfobulbaceae bacterium]